MELSSVLDRPTECAEARYNYVERFLKNDLVCHAEIMASYAKDLLKKISKKQSKIVLIIDQTRVNEHIELLMISVRYGNRALPLHWCARATNGGGIGFSEQKRLLEEVCSWVPEDVDIVLFGDRFYGTSDLIKWCQDRKWGYRLRLKGNLYLYQNKGPDKTLNTLKEEGVTSIEKGRLRSGVVTNIGIIHEKGHKEAWYIAMDQKQNEYTTRDYGMRWIIENMFSDFKSRGFSLMQSKIKIAERLERLILVMSVATYWAVSTGFWHQQQHSTNAEKKDQKS